MIKMNEEEYIEYLEYLKKREEVYKDIFRLDYIGNDYPKVTNDEINKITKTECAFNKLQNNWNELKKGLQSLFEFDEGVVSNDYLECVHDTLNKMQELEEEKDG